MNMYQRPFLPIIWLMLVPCVTSTSAFVPHHGSSTSHVIRRKMTRTHLPQQPLQMTHNRQPSDSSSDEQYHPSSSSSSSEKFDFEDLRLRMALGFSDSGNGTPEDVYTVVYRASDRDDTYAYLSYDAAVLAFESEMECLKFCVQLRQEGGFIDPKVREMKLSALEQHCESLNGVAVRPVPKAKQTYVGPNGELLIVENDGVDGSPDRGVQVELVNRLYRMSPSDGNNRIRRDGVLVSNDDVGVGNGGRSWE